MVTITGNIFFKAQLYGIKFIKLIPDYDAKYGVILKVIYPSTETDGLDKSWISIQKDNESFKFRFPAFIGQCGETEAYEDAFGGAWELCRIRSVDGSFNKLIAPKRLKYDPYFTADGKIHISLSYARDHFPAKRDVYISVVINPRIVVHVFGGKDLIPGEYATRLIRKEYEFVSRPLIPQLRLKYAGYSTTNSILTIKTKRGHEKHRSRIGRRIRGICQRTFRIRRIGNENGGTSPVGREQEGNASI